MSDVKLKFEKIHTNLDCNCIEGALIDTKSQFGLKTNKENIRQQVDFKQTRGTERGVSYKTELNEINKDEKSNFCDWICENGDKHDFRRFNIIFDMIENVLTKANATDEK